MHIGSISGFGKNRIICLAASLSFTTCNIPDLRPDILFFPVFVAQVEQVIANRNKTHHLDVATPYAEKLSVTGMVFRERDAQNIFSALHFIFRGATRYSASAEDLYSCIVGATDISKEAAKIICKAWQQEVIDNDEAEKSQGIELSLGTLLEMDWRVGVSISSSRTRELQSPFVTVAMKVSDSAGKIQSRVVELTIPEFYRLRDTMKGALGRLEMV